MCVSWMPRANFSNFVNASGNNVLLSKIEVMMPHPGINLNLTCSSKLVNTSSGCDNPISNVCFCPCEFPYTLLGYVITFFNLGNIASINNSN